MSDSGRRIAVTGGAGFIGSHLARALSDRGHRLLIVDDCSSGSHTPQHERISYTQRDICAPETAETITEFDPDTLYHLAARHYIPYCNENPRETFNVNVIGTRRVLEAVRRASVETVVYASSAAVYGPAKEPHVESERPRPTDIYGQTKLVGEDIVERFATRYDFESVMYRLFNVYGPGETNPHVIPAILDQIDDEEGSISLGNLRPKRDFVHVSDVVDALLLPLDSATRSFDRYNVGTGTAHSVAELVEVIRDLVSTDFGIDQDDERLRESDRPYLCADIRRIQEEFGWSPSYEVRAGLKQLIETEYERLTHA
ncbi:NAD-dependent epimerase/dehydratase family protein [Halosimplex rubrum]|uniref:NAD-dependent epimerase/dehydratase family protein n=1 Tax=Halosimplex rubrum TaxID=869889 RepID=A0A7D5T5F6_9EURY|nr:NAD-dependent epimerase/dehydratase family protein [Halosimplex rubrum]QLH76835.1 NAD-dependent epimerase/dehydratase family protein [Halosimplex rubrum]